jgi:hypothetical protein
MRSIILLITFLLSVSALAQQPKLAKPAAPLSLPLAISVVKNIVPLPAININCSLTPNCGEENNFGEVGAFIYGAVYLFNQLAEKQPFWKPDKGLIIPLTIGNNPLQVMPSMNYDEKDIHKNNYSLKICLMF